MALGSIVGRAQRGGAALVLATLACSCGSPDERYRLGEAEPVPPPTATDYALGFDGESDYASLGTAWFPAAHASQSLAAWVRFEHSERQQTIFAMRRGDESGHQLVVEDGRAAVFRFGPARALTETNMELSHGEWHHLAFVQMERMGDDEMETPRLRLYVDGEEVYEGTGAAGDRTPTSAWLGSPNGFEQFFAGQLDDLALWSRALERNEVESLAKGGVPRSEEALIVLFTFDEVQGGRVYDRSGHGNHASLGDGVAQNRPMRTVSSAP